MMTDEMVSNLNKVNNINDNMSGNLASSADGGGGCRNTQLNVL